MGASSSDWLAIGWMLPGSLEEFPVAVVVLYSLVAIISHYALLLFVALSAAAVVLVGLCAAESNGRRCHFHDGADHDLQDDCSDQCSQWRS